MPPNLQLQRRREATPSRLVPGTTMSRAELADAVNEHVWRNARARRELDAHTIARYERGVVRWPNADYRHALRDILDASDDELGFLRARRREPSDNQPDPTLTVNLFSPFGQSPHPVGFPDLSPTARRHGRVGKPEVDAIRAATKLAASTENLHGGGSSAESADQALSRFAPMVNGTVSAKLRRPLFEAVGNLSSVLGYTAFDAGVLADADRRFQFALWCADTAGSWDLRASTLADMARRSAFVGDSDGALSLIELAQVRSDRLSSTVRAMLSAMRAQYLAALGHTQEVLAEVSRADEFFAIRTPEIDPPWMCYYDTAEHLGSTGKALAIAAETFDSVEVAAPRLTDAINLHSSEYPRSRTFSQIRLATLTMKVGDPRQAVAIGLDSLSHSRGLKSTRITTELRGLATAASRHRRITEVRELREAIATTTSPRSSS